MKNLICNTNHWVVKELFHVLDQVHQGLFHYAFLRWSWHADSSTLYDGNRFSSDSGSSDICLLLTTIINKIN